MPADEAADLAGIVGTRVVVETGAKNRAKFVANDAARMLFDDPRTQPSVLEFEAEGNAAGTTGVSEDAEILDGVLSLSLPASEGALLWLEE